MNVENMKGLLTPAEMRRFIFSYFAISLDCSYDIIFALGRQFKRNTFLIEYTKNAIKWEKIEEFNGNEIRFTLEYMSLGIWLFDNEYSVGYTCGSNYGIDTLMSTWKSRHLHKCLEKVFVSIQRDMTGLQRWIIFQNKLEVIGIRSRRFAIAKNLSTVLFIWISGECIYRLSFRGKNIRMSCLDSLCHTNWYNNIMTVPIDANGFKIIQRFLRKASRTKIYHPKNAKDKIWTWRDNELHYHAN